METSTVSSPPFVLTWILPTGCRAQGAFDTTTETGMTCTDFVQIPLAGISIQSQSGTTVPERNPGPAFLTVRENEIVSSLVTLQNWKIFSSIRSVEIGRGDRGISIFIRAIPPVERM